MSSSVAHRVFLWDAGQQRPSEPDFVPRAGGWWEQYYNGLVQSGHLSEAALQELTRTSRDIAGLLPRVGGAERPRPFKGVVVGAVQSGKTQSMMGVAATALDNGYRIIVVLAGLKDDLRSQTARRFNTSLLKQSDPVYGVPGATTLGMPVGSVGEMKAFAPPYHVDCHDYAPLAPRMNRALKDGKSCVVVIKKHPASLSDFRMVLAATYRDFPADALPTLILDDECDEATVPGGEMEKAIPEGIVGLWADTNPTPLTAYVGYTATAAANLLQHPDWALYPHWTYLLRFPGGATSPMKFAEANSDSWYTGGDCFYEDFGDEPGDEENFLINTSIAVGDLGLPVKENGSLLEALIAYFVAGAYRLALNPSWTFGDLRNLPDPHSMMIHTSAAQEDHSRWARGIQSYFGGSNDGGTVRFSVAKLSEMLVRNEPNWRNWFELFKRSRERIYESRPHRGVERVASWEQVKLRLAEVFENVRLKVVNSDAEGGSLDYRPPLGPDGAPLRCPDLYVIAVGGSRLSRGITVEGLCISYFARWATFRHDDTILQMSRWFGYRGPHLEFCRLFTTREAFLGLKEISDNDTQLRVQLYRLMSEQRSPKEATVAFNASPYSRPTAKVGSGTVVDLTFSPFVRVFRTIETGALSAVNEARAKSIVDSIRSRSAATVTRATGLPRGYVSQGWTLGQVADVLDAWEFIGHNPPIDNHLLSQFHRRPDPSRPVCTGLDERWDPYAVAAYLRHWANWAEERGESAPTFNVGVAFGEVSSDTAPFDFDLLNRIVTSDDQVLGGWTGASPNWRGDIVFDNPHPQFLDERKSRLAGAPGLLLLYVVHKNAKGKDGTGKARTHHSPLYGISIPAGGPNFLRVLSATGGPLA